MLKKLTSGATAVYVTAAMALIFICSLVFSPSLKSPGQRSVIGYAGGESVTIQDVAAMKRALHQIIATENINPNDAEQQAMLNNQVNAMVQQHAALRAMMKQYRYVVPKEMIEADIRRNPAFQENGQYSAKKFKAFLESQRLDIETFMTQQSVIYFQQTLLAVMAKLNEPTQSEKLLFDEVAATKRAIKLKSLDFNQIKVTSPSDKELHTYYENHKLDYVLPTQTQYRYTVIDRSLFDEKKQPAHAELVEFFKQHIERYAEPEQVLVQKAVLSPQTGAQLTPKQMTYLQSLMHQNASFDQIIQTIINQNGKHYALSLNEPHWQTVSQLPASLQVKAFIQNKAPQITANGGAYEILTNKSYKEARDPELAMVIAKVTKDYKEKMAESAYQAHLDQVIDLSHSKTMTWQDLKKLIPQATIKTTALGSYASHQATKPFSQYPVLATWLQDAYQEEVGHLSIKYVDQAMVVIEKTQAQPKRPQSFAEVKADISKKLINEARILKGEQTVDAWVKTAQSKKTQDTFFSAWQTNNDVRYVNESSQMPYLVWAAALTLSKQNSAAAVAVQQSEKIKQWLVVKLIGDQKIIPDQAWSERISSDWQRQGLISVMNQITGKYVLKFV